MSRDFGARVALRVESARQELAAQWLERLRSILSVDPTRIFPSEEILDHIPTLIAEIAGYIASDEDPVAANTAIQSKAHELGELRFSQRASIHQLLREYEILGLVIGDFIRGQLDELTELATPGEAVEVFTRLHEAVFVLLQMTVDTFASRYTEKIEEQTTQLEGFNRLVSHELRQPLNSVQNSVQILSSPAADDPEKRRFALDVAQRNLRRLGDLIRMLGALVNPDHDNIQVQTVDASRIVDAAMQQLQELADSKGVELRNTAAPTEMAIDVARLELVLVNLLSNGIKYRDPAKAERFVAVHVEATPDACHLRVEDNGLGVPVADQPAIFRRFTRAHAERDDELRNDGVGLGLAIVAECVKAMRGTIRMESLEGGGSTFLITIPQQARADASEDAAS